MAVQTKMLLQRIHQAPAVAFEETIAIYRDAVAFLMEAMDASIPDLSVYDGKSIKNAMERLVNKTKDNPAPAYPDFNRRFHKFPSYLRRAAIASAFGKLRSYRSNYDNWYQARQQAFVDGKKFHKKAPAKQFDLDDLPVFYKGIMFNRTGETPAEIKVYHQNDWVWLDISFQAQDLDKRGLLDKDGKLDWKQCNPKLIRKGKQ